MRCFIAIKVPKEILKEINKIQNNLPFFIGKKTEIENLHLTLKFLGEINKEKIKEVLKKLKEIKTPKFETEIKNLGFFDNRKSKTYSKKIIIWIYLSNCSRLQKIIDEQLKNLFEKETRFMSHLTIARVKDLKDKKEFLENLRKIKIPKLKFKVKEFYLMKSDLTKKKSQYEIIEKYELR